MSYLTTPYPGMALATGVRATVLDEPWPPEVHARYLTVGWASVDVLIDLTEDAKRGISTHVLRIACTGCGDFAIPADEQSTFTVPIGGVLPSSYTAVLFDFKRQAQRHAERCRAIRRPA